MRFLALFAIAVAADAAVLPVDHFQDFNACTTNALINTSEVSASQLGTGTWTRWTGGSFAHIRIESSAAVDLLQPVSVGGTNKTTTGNKWYRVNHGSSAAESLTFTIPAGTRGSNCEIRCVLRLFTTNGTGGTGINLDEIDTTPNQQGVVQLQTDGNTVYRFRSHASNGTDGAAINQTPGTVIHIVATRMNSEQSMLVSIYNSSGAQLGTSRGTWDPANVPNYVDTIKFQANYLDGSGLLTGYYEIGGISMRWGDTLAPVPVDPPPTYGRSSPIRLP